MSQDLPTVAENAPLDRVFELLRGSGAHVVGVVDSQNRLLGYITPETIAELVMIQSARSVRSSQSTTATEQQPA
jgi:CBS domain containing-hemolysin-like protein